MSKVRTIKNTSVRGMQYVAHTTRILLHILCHVPACVGKYVCDEFSSRGEEKFHAPRATQLLVRTREFRETTCALSRQSPLQWLYDGVSPSLRRRPGFEFIGVKNKAQCLHVISYRVIYHFKECCFVIYCPAQTDNGSPVVAGEKR